MTILRPMKLLVAGWLVIGVGAELLCADDAETTKPATVNQSASNNADQTKTGDQAQKTPPVAQQEKQPAGAPSNVKIYDIQTGSAPSYSSFISNFSSVVTDTIPNSNKLLVQGNDDERKAVEFVLYEIGAIDKAELQWKINDGDRQKSTFGFYRLQNHNAPSYAGLIGRICQVSTYPDPTHSIVIVLYNRPDADAKRKEVEALLREIGAFNPATSDEAQTPNESNRKGRLFGGRRRPAAQESELADPKKTHVNKVIRLNTLDATMVAEQLTSLDNESTFIADRVSNNVLISAPPVIMNQAEKIISVLESANSKLAQTTSLQSMNIRVQPDVTQSIANNPETQNELNELSRLESKAANLAEQIRKHNGPNELAVRKELDETLTAALAVKIRLENLQIAQFEERLSRLKVQVARRATGVKQIVDRRARELTEEDASKWTPSELDLSRNASSGVAATGPNATIEAAVDSNPDPNRSSTGRDRSQTARSSPQTFDDQFAKNAFGLSFVEEYRKLANRLSDSDREASEALRNKYTYSTNEKSSEHQRLLSALHYAQAALTLKANHDDCEIVLKDLQLQALAAQSELQAATKNWQALNAAYGVGTANITSQQVNDAENRVSQARVALERVDAKQKFCRTLWNLDDGKNVSGSTTTKILVAKKDLNDDAALSQSTVEYREWPTRLVPEGSITKDEQWTGSKLRNGVLRETPILIELLQPKQSSNDSIPASKVPPPSPNSPVRANLGPRPQSNASDQPPSLDECLEAIRNAQDNQRATVAFRRINELWTSGELSSNQADSVLEAMIHRFAQPAATEVSTRGSNLPERMLKRFGGSVLGRVTSKILTQESIPEKKIALTNLSPLWELADESYFPSLSQQLMKLAESSDPELRFDALRILVATLPITKLETKFHSVERQEMVKRLSIAIPRDRVFKALKSALADPSADTVVRTTELITNNRENIEDNDLINATIESLLKIRLRGTRSASGQEAFRQLSSYRDHATVIVPKLIEMLKTEKSEFGYEPGSIRANIAFTLSSFGTKAKDAIPILEDDLLLLKSKPGANDGIIKMLEEAIRRIKGIESAPAK